MYVPATGDFRLNTAADTEKFGAAVAGALRKGEAVCLTGPLGAGKSVLARGLIRRIAPQEADIPSPTFTLAQFYRGEKLAVAHFDLYRLARADEAFELGLDEALAEGAAVIEWAEKLGRHLPRNRLDIEMAVDGEARHVSLRPHGVWEDRPLEL